MENYDLSSLSEQWNKKLKSIRISSIVISIAMIILGIVCFIYPVETITVLEYIASLLIIAVGVWEIVDYTHGPVFFRMPGRIASGVMNIILGLLLFCSPEAVTNSTFTFLFGLLMLEFGVNKLSYSSLLGRYQVPNHGWVIASGILDIVASLVFFIMPLFSTVVLSYMLAFYLVMIGVTLLIEICSMKNKA
jgi:uncharacterized membrane protein HdeD (DUF308 family)